MLLTRYDSESIQRSGVGSRAMAFGAAGGGEGRGGALPVWSPAVDVIEDENEITIHAELPGMNKEEIDIDLSGGALTLRGERRQAVARKGENYHRIERRYGIFERSFKIDVPIVLARVSAEYEQGVLTIHLPKPAGSEPRVISFSVG